MTTIAFLGTGLMGAGFVRRARHNGLQVQAWNRSPAKARALAAQDDGVRAFDHAADAVAGAARVHLSLSDDAAVDAVLEPLADRLPPGTWILDHTTTAVRPTAERAARWAARGPRYVHAPVFMAPANCAEGTGVMMLSGPADWHQALQPALQAMTGKLVYLGPQPERAAAFKLFGNLAILGILGILGDIGRLAAAVDIDMADAFTLFEHFNPGQSIQQRGRRIADGKYDPPSFEMSMARKDLRLMQEEAARGGQSLAVVQAVAALLDAGITRGEGALDVAAAMRVLR